jgi:hypothetical protein
VTEWGKYNRAEIKKWLATQGGDPLTSSRGVA